jgi:hypothetical protein
MPSDSSPDVAASIEEDLAGRVVYDRNVNAAGGIAKVSYTHADMIDCILANPTISKGELAIRYGYSPGWVSRVLSSDSFRLMYARRRDDLVDPLVTAQTEERFRALVDHSLDLLQEKVSQDTPLDGLVKVLDVAQKALGYGVAKNAQISVQNYVVALPQKMESSQAWAEKYKDGIPIEGTVVRENP